MVVVGARLGDGRGLARLLVCGGEGAVLGYPVSSCVEQDVSTPSSTMEDGGWSSMERRVDDNRGSMYIPIFAVMCKLARVAGAGVGAGYPTIGKIELHHIVDVLKDDLVAVEEHDALHGTNALSVAIFHSGIFIIPLCPLFTLFFSFLLLIMSFA